MVDVLRVDVSRTYYPDSDPTGICSFSIMPSSFNWEGVWIPFYNKTLSKAPLQPMNFCTEGEHANHYIINAVSMFFLMNEAFNLRKRCLITWLLYLYRISLQIFMLKQYDSILFMRRYISYNGRWEHKHARTILIIYVSNTIYGGAF